MREDIVEGDDSENIVGALTNAFMANMQRSGMPGARGTAASWGAAARGAAQRTVQSPRFSATQLANQAGGASNDNKLRAPLGLGTHVFIEAAPTTFKFIVEPQEAFRGERLIVDVGADATTAGVLVSVDEIVVGSLPQSPSVEFGIPAVMFRADATYAGMEWQICPAGTKIQVTVSLSAALGEGETATVQVGVYGVWIR